MRVRKNQNKMTKAEWKILIAAIDAIHGTSAAPPAYRRFVSLHVQAMSVPHMDWQVHTMQMPDGTFMRGTFFLAWHRRFVKLLEDRLQAVNPAVTIPYWDSVTDRSIPAALDDSALLSKWSVTRSWNPSHLAHPSDLSAVRGFAGTFAGFQTLLEGAIHAGTHNAVGGDMAGAASPTDPLFWLHHAFMDKLWADWQASSNGAAPSDTATILKPRNMQTGVPFGVRISSLLKIAGLGYSYA